MAITLAGIQWILISVSVSSHSLIIREGSTGELVIAKEVCILNIRLQLNLSKRKMTAFCFYCSLFWCRRYWMKHLWPKRSKTAFPVERLWSDVELHWTLNRNAHSINLNIIWTSHDLSPLSLCRLIKNSTFSARPYSFVDSNGSSG